MTFYYHPHELLFPRSEKQILESFKCVFAGERDMDITEIWQPSWIYANYTHLDNTISFEFQRAFYRTLYQNFVFQILFVICL